MSEDTAERGTDVLDLRNRPAHEAAKVLYEAMVAEADALGQNADVEVCLFTPEQDAAHWLYGQGVWRVCWEAGPYDWGVRLSNAGRVTLERTGVEVVAPEWSGTETWYLEPFYGHDVGFARK